MTDMSHFIRQVIDLLGELNGSQSRWFYFSASDQFLYFPGLIFSQMLFASQEENFCNQNQSRKFHPNAGRASTIFVEPSFPIFLTFEELCSHLASFSDY